MPAQHTDRAFEEELRLLRDRLLLMAGRVEEMIDGAMRALVDRVVCPLVPEHFRAVGLHYRDFGQVADEAVAAIMAAQGKE